MLKRIPYIQELSSFLYYRAVFREIDGLTQMVQFIGNSEYKDLHVLAVIVLSNCLEDIESVEVSGLL